jgi:cell volume regulation protein A
MFLGLGLLATPHRLVTVALPALGISLFLIFVARPIAVWLCLSPFKFNWREKTFVSWVGLRGAVGIFLGMMPTLANLPRASLYFDVAFFVVLVSLLLQGWTTRRVAFLLRQVLPRVTGTVQRYEIDLPGQHDFELIGYPVLPDSRILNVAKLPKWARAAMIVRDRQILEPNEAGKLKTGDYAYYLAPALRVPQLDGLFASLAERGSAKDKDAEFEIHGATPLGNLAAIYELKLVDLDPRQTLAQLFAERFEGTVEIGDSLPLGNCILTVRSMDGDDVVEAGLRFDEEAKPKASRLRRAVARLTGGNTGKKA